MTRQTLEDFMATVSTASLPAARVSIEQDWRFAELVARTWLEPGLAESYTQDPRGVLADFGIELAAGEPVPALPAVAGMKLVIEDLDTAARSMNTTASFSWAPAQH
ncbi:TIGR04351 family putative TOMM peptide [Kitasatospora sp. NPDC059571]|uniref:TIGR04351 family putative TOMM peptide n=1 Tax=Kitasatospora sp. NPDC059571 TaxID=3346871 RepID=UPI003681EA5C